MWALCRQGSLFESSSVRNTYVHFEWRLRFTFGRETNQTYAFQNRALARITVRMVGEKRLSFRVAELKVDPKLVILRS